MAVEIHETNDDRNASEDHSYAIGQQKLSLAGHVPPKSHWTQTLAMLIALARDGDSDCNLDIDVLKNDLVSSMMTAPLAAPAPPP